MPYVNVPKVRDRAFHFISPRLPAGRGLSGKELHPGQVAHKGHDLFPGLVRLFAVGFNRGNEVKSTIPDFGTKCPEVKGAGKEADPCPM